MGLGSRAVEAIAREHVFKPITGDVLFVGRQTVYKTPDELCGLLQNYGISFKRDAIEIDKQTIWRKQDEHVGAELVTDRSIFRALGNDRVRAIDVSDYEGAELIHDLNFPLPNNLRGVADFVVDGSTLDNCWNPAQTLRNFADLLRPGGRLVSINAYSTWETAYVIMPPLWYYDYFVWNRWADVKLYVVVHGEGHSIYVIDPAEYARRRRNMGHIRSHEASYVVLLAERGEDSTTDRIPIQQHYRSDDQWDYFLANLSIVQQSKRPHLLNSNGDSILRDYPGGYKWVDPNYEARDLPPLTRVDLAVRRRRMHIWNKLRSAFL